MNYTRLSRIIHGIYKRISTESSVMKRILFGGLIVSASAVSSFIKSSSRERGENKTFIYRPDPIDIVPAGRHLDEIRLPERYIG